MRAARRRWRRSGFGIPALVEWEAGVSRWSNHLPLDGVPFRDLMSERLGLPVLVDNDGNASMLAEARGGRGRGRPPRGDDLARHRHRRRAVAERRGVPRRDRRGGRDGSLGAEAARARMPGRLPRHRLLRGARVGDRDRARGAAACGGATPDSALGRRLAAEQEITGGIVTEMAHDGDPVACEVLAEMGERLGFGLVGLVNTFNPEVIVIGGGAVRAGELLLEPARRVIADARSAAGARERAPRARPLRRRGRDDGRRADGARGARMTAGGGPPAPAGASEEGP